MWLIPPPTLKLATDEVHVWLVAVDRATARVQSFKSFLSDDEHIKQVRFHFQKDRDRFIICRGILRQILSRYLGCKAQDLKFCYNEFGKPALCADTKQPICFNLSHSHNLALIAVSHNCVGVDIEYIRTDLAIADMAESIFSSTEYVLWQALPPNLKTEAFFTCWTRKEAYLKATGKGLSLAMNAIDVSFIPKQPAILLKTAWDAQEPYRWLLQELSPDPNYVAAIAVASNNWQVKYWQWCDDFLGECHKI